jgi:hypothetical protein
MATQARISLPDLDVAGVLAMCATAVPVNARVDVAIEAHRIACEQRSKSRHRGFFYFQPIVDALAGEGGHGLIEARGDLAGKCNGRVLLCHRDCHRTAEYQAKLDGTE